ncbi:MAG: SRPBCC family protein [Pseudomonadota bacterium]
MQLLTEQTISIARSVEATYQYATNLEHFAEWFPGVLSIESANTLEHGQRGKEYLETIAAPLSGKRKIKICVKEADFGTVFMTEGEFSPLMPRMEILFQATGAESCSVTWRMFSRNDGFLFKATLLHLFRSVLRKRAAVGVKRLQKILEERP